MNNERTDELLALAALGELTDAEQAELDEALADDASLSAELDADLQSAAELQRTAAEPPPARLRANVLAAISDVVQDQPAADGTGPAHERSDAVVSLADARQRRSRLWQPLLAAAAVLALVVVGTTFVNRGSDAPSFADVMQADDAVSHSLTGSLEGDLRLVYSPGVNALALDGTNVSRLSENETYQVWLVDDTGATSVGLFRPHDDGSVMETFEDVDPSGFDIGVTVEPAAGSEQPTLPVVASS